MIRFRGIIFSSIAFLGLCVSAVRADSVFSLNPPNNGAKELFIFTPQVTFTREADNPAEVGHSLGTLSITAYPNNPLLYPTTAVKLSPDGATLIKVNPISALNITFKIDVAPNGSVAVSSGQMDVEGTPKNGVPTIFNISNDLSAFGINLNGSANEPLAFMFTRGTSTYYTGNNEGYIVGQLQSLSNPNVSPFQQSNFFIPVGSKNTWDGTNYKMDIFAVALPLPAPLLAGSLMLSLTVATTLLLKRRISA